MNTKEKPAVFVVTDEKHCSECGTEIFHGGLFLPMKPEGLLCVACADLDELEFLGSGDTALTRRATKHSPVCYVAFKFSRARKRFERQGILVQSEAIEKAESECAEDQALRKARQARNHERLTRLDGQFVKTFAVAVRAQFPKMPPNREREIAEHACQKYSGRVGRSAAAKELDTEAITLAVIAHIRHRETNYDTLLFSLGDRDEARRAVRDKVERVLDKWRGK
jgi:hypothetical protein